MSEPSGEKPYDPKTWQPEDGDPFKGNGYDRARDALSDAIGDEFDRNRRRRRGGSSSPAGFLLGWIWRYFFPVPRR